MTDIPDLQRMLVEAADRQAASARPAFVRRGRPSGGTRAAFAGPGRSFRGARPVLAVLAAGVVAIVVGVAVLGSSPRDREIAATPTPGVTSVPSVAPTPSVRRPASIDAAFGVFRRPAGPRDSLGARAPRDLANADVRRIAATPKARVFLARKGNDLCLVNADARGRVGGWGCGPAGVYLDGHRPQGTFSDENGPSLIAFAFPDGVRQVTLTLADGSRASYPVTSNGFARDLAARPVRLEWRAPDGTAQHASFEHAPAFKAQDFYPVLTRAETPADTLDGLPGARLIVRNGDARAWLVPRLGAVCLVLRAGAAEASGCRAKVADVRYPLIVAVAPGGGAPRAVAIAWSHAAKGFRLAGDVTRGTDALLTVSGDGAQTLRYTDPDRNPRTERFPPLAAGFVLHATPEPPTKLPPAQ